jgi:Tfp pilus assembly protein PilV
MVIVGVGILATVQLLAACTQQNRAAADATTAMFLANNLQEAMADLPFSDPSGSATFGLEETGQPLIVWDDIDDFHGFLASPPVDGTRQPIAEMGRFSQRVTVQRVDPQKLSLDAAGTDAARVTVRVFRRSPDGTVAELSRLSWVRMRT